MDKYLWGTALLGAIILWLLAQEPLVVDDNETHRVYRSAILSCKGAPGLIYIWETNGTKVYDVINNKNYDYWFCHPVDTPKGEW